MRPTPTLSAFLITYFPRWSRYLSMSPRTRSYALDRLGVEWPEVRRGEKLSDTGTNAPTTIGRVPQLGLNVAMLDPMQVVRIVCVRQHACVNENIVRVQMTMHGDSAEVRLGIVPRDWSSSTACT